MAVMVWLLDENVKAQIFLDDSSITFHYDVAIFVEHDLEVCNEWGIRKDLYRSYATHWNLGGFYNYERWFYRYLRFYDYFFNGTR